MLANMDRLRLVDLLHDPGYCGALDAQGLYELVLGATDGDERAASKAMADRAMARLRAGQPA